MGFGESFNEGAQGMNTILIGPIQRQSAIEQLQAQRQANAIQDINVQKAQMTYADMLGARQDMANAQPTPAQTTTTVPPVPATPPTAQAQIGDKFGLTTNPTYSPQTGFTAAMGTTGTPNTQSPVASSISGVLAPPPIDQTVSSGMLGYGARIPTTAEAGFTGLQPETTPDANKDLLTGPQTTTETPADTSGFALPQSPLSPSMAAMKNGTMQTTTTPEVPPDYGDILLKSAIRTADPEKIKEAMAIKDALDKQQGDMNAIGSKKMSDYYTLMAKMQLSAAQSAQMEKGITTVGTIVKEGGYKLLEKLAPVVSQIPGMQNLDLKGLAVSNDNRFMIKNIGNDMLMITDNDNPNPASNWKIEKIDINDFKSFRSSRLAEGFTEGQVNDLWHQQKVAEATKVGVTVAAARAEAIGANMGGVPTPTPGVSFDKQTKQYFTNGPDGSRTNLSSDQVKQMNLEFKEETPTNDIKVMQQSVPQVLDLIGAVRKDMSKVTQGPLASRFQDVMTNKIGAPNPDFKALTVDTGLLETRLMKMHTGARGGEYIFNHFKQMLDSGKSSPENMQSALDVIEAYAKDTAKSHVRPAGGQAVSDPLGLR